eukprot:2511021-Rhodomonas_salina.4
MGRGASERDQSCVNGSTQGEKECGTQAIEFSAPLCKDCFTNALPGVFQSGVPVVCPGNIERWGSMRRADASCKLYNTPQCSASLPTLLTHSFPHSLTHLLDFSFSVLRPPTTGSALMFARFVPVMVAVWV